MLFLPSDAPARAREELLLYRSRGPTSEARDGGLGISQAGGPHRIQFQDACTENKSRLTKDLKKKMTTFPSTTMSTIDLFSSQTFFLLLSLYPNPVRFPA